MSDEQIKKIQEFVYNGGYLVTAALPWVWVSYDHLAADKIPDAWMNRLVRPFGAEYANGYTEWPKGSSASVHDEEGKQVKSVIRP